MKLLNTDTVSQAQENLKHQTKNFMIKTQTIEIQQALSYVCAQDVIALEYVPAFRRSTVDGYAIIAQDSYGASESNPVFYDVVGHLAIDEYKDMTVHCQEAIQVQTGSMIPHEANAVLMVEYCEMYAQNKMVGYKAMSIGENIVDIGEDIQKGECLIQKGKRLDAFDIGIMASLGMTHIDVYQPLTITIISTGDELVDLNQTRHGSQIYDINSYVLSSRAKSLGLLLHQRLCMKDQEELIEEAVKKATQTSDIVILSGGSSKGNKDYTEAVLEKITHNVMTHGIAIKPGKPTIIAFDQENQTIMVGLPGHPMAAFMMFELILGNWLYEYMHITKPLPYYATMQENVSSNQGRETCLLVRLENSMDGYLAYPIHTKSGNISRLSKAHGYVIIPRQKEGLKKGERIQVEVFL